MQRHLPVFPLNTVLFPGATLPLRIFEPRYRQMLRDCMDGDRRFGVVLIKHGAEVGGDAQPYMTGTIARIEVIGAPERGALPVTVIGEQRFRILSLDRSKPYLSAEVEVLPDPDEAPPAEVLSLAVDATRRYVSLMLAAQGAWHSGLTVPDDPLVLSYFIGVIAASAPDRTRQRLLDADDIADRLQAGVALLEEEGARMERSIMRSGPGNEPSRFSSN